MTAWIGIIGTAIGAIIGGGLALLNAHLQTRRQAQQERRKLILSKLEELHETISHIRGGHRELFTQIMAKQDDTEVKKQARESLALSLERIQMLVAFYAPELSKHIPKVLKESVGYMESLITYAIAERQKEDQKTNALDAPLSKHEELQGALTAMQMELEVLSRKYI